MGTKDKPLGSKRISAGYVMVKVAPGSSGWRLEQRIVMEQKLGRLLGNGECVRHIDKNPLNNSPENLEIKPPKTNTQWGGDHPHCRSCGTTEKRHVARGYCSRCYPRAPKKWYTLNVQRGKGMNHGS